MKKKEEIPYGRTVPGYVYSCVFSYCIIIIIRNHKNHGNKYDIIKRCGRKYTPSDFEEVLKMLM